MAKAPQKTITIAQHRAAGYTKITIWCVPCGHNADVVVTDGRFPDDWDFVAVRSRFRCSKCGSKQLTSQICMSEHYGRDRDLTGFGRGNSLGEAGGLKKAQ